MCHSNEVSSKIVNIVISDSLGRQVECGLRIFLRGNLPLITVFFPEPFLVN